MTDLMSDTATIAELSADEVLMVSGGLRDKDECIDSGGTPTLQLGGYVCDF